MAGITQDQVNGACADLTNEGKEPTLSAVRERLGSGSYATLAKFVKVWRSSQPVTGVLSAASDLVVPSTIKEQALKMAAQMWQESQKLADEQLKAERSLYDEKISELVESSAEAYKTLDERENALNRLHLENQELHRQLDDLSAQRMRDIAALNDALGRASALESMLEKFKVSAPAPAAPVPKKPVKKDTKTFPLE